MGFLDSLKKSLGGGSAATETVKGPSRVLREAGIDPSGLDIDIRPDGSVSVSGHVASDGLREQIGEVLSGMPQVKSVDNRLVVGAPPAPEPEPAPVVPETPAAAQAAPEPPAPVPAAEAAPDDSADGPTYTVESGDTLWKIAKEHYGNGAKYTAIFEANRDILDDPDRIRPGQVLKIPPLED